MPASTLATAFAPPHAAPASLDGQLTEPVVLPGDPRWDDARRAWNLAADQRPAAVARAVNATEVRAVVRWARAAGLRVAAQGTGHGACAMGPLDDTVLLRTGAMRHVQIDAARRTARVGGGAVWGDVVADAHEHGLAALAGTSASVGVAGYTLGGGMGWLARRHGLACNSVTAVELVTGTGEFVRADAYRDAALFWAVRGGSGNFGVVTALEFSLYPVSHVLAGAVYYPAEHAAAVLAAYRDWVGTLPDEMTSHARLINAPPLPVVPEPLRGRALVAVEACWLGGTAEGLRLLHDMRRLAPCVMDTFSTIPASMLQQVHGDPPVPVAGASRHQLLRALPDDAIAALLDVAGPFTSSPLAGVTFRHLGGALGRARPEHGALASVDGAFAAFAVGAVPTPELAARVAARLDDVAGALAPWATGGALLNFSDRPGALGAAFPARVRAQLAAVKRAYDPADVIRGNHELRCR